MADNTIIRRSSLATTLGDSEVRLRQQEGILSSVWRGAVHLGPVPDDALERYRLTVRGAAVAGGAERVVSHQSAAALHGIALLRPDTSKVHFTTPKSGRAGKKVYLHRDRLPKNHITVVDDVRVTTPARTVADIARFGTFEQAVCALDSGLRAAIPYDDIEAIAASCATMKGVDTLRRALAVADARSESVGESFSRATILAVGLPAPDLQVEIFDDAGHAIGRCDFAWKDKVIGEFDGKVKYTGQFGTSASETVFAEKRREDAIRRTGRIVVRWTWDDLADTVAFRALILGALRNAGLA